MTDGYFRVFVYFFCFPIKHRNMIRCKAASIAFLLV